jgi:hypothetical protein
LRRRCSQLAKAAMTSELADGLELGQTRDNCKASGGPKVCNVCMRGRGFQISTQRRSYDAVLGEGTVGEAVME